MQQCFYLVSTKPRKTCTYSRQALCADGFELSNAVYASQVMSRGKIGQRIVFKCFQNHSETPLCSKLQKANHSSLECVRIVVSFEAKPVFQIPSSLDIVGFLFLAALVQNYTNSLSECNILMKLLGILNFRIIITTSKIDSLVEFTSRYDF